MKHDLDRRTSEVRSLRSAGGASEAVFVPSGPDAAEDDGWVLSLVYDADRDTSELLVAQRGRLHRRTPSGGSPAPARSVRLPRKLGARQRLTAGT